jgi:flagellar biosynthesis/type III secretory pathway M-ring protein FliF/YscJ
LASIAALLIAVWIVWRAVERQAGRPDGAAVPQAGQAPSGGLEQEELTQDDRRRLEEVLQKHQAPE